MRHSSFDNSLPQIQQGSKSLYSPSVDEKRQSKIRRRRSSIQTASEMGKITEDFADFGVSGSKQGSEATVAKMAPFMSKPGTPRRNSIATTADKLPVMITNNKVRLRKYSCPEMQSNIGVVSSSQELPRRKRSTGSQPNTKLYGAFLVDNDEPKATQVKQVNKQDGEKVKQIIDSRHQLESKGKSKTADSLPKLNPESKEELAGWNTPIKHSNDFGTFRAEERTIGTESTNSLHIDSQSVSTFHEEIVSLLSYSGNVRKTDGLISPKPTANRGRSSIISWLKEINLSDN